MTERKIDWPPGLEPAPGSLDDISDVDAAAASIIGRNGGSVEDWKRDRHPFQENPELMHSSNYGHGRPRNPYSVPSTLRALAVGASHLFTQYRMPSQLSTAVRAAKLAGGKYTCSRELSLVDGECIGVRVTRTE